MFARRLVVVALVSVTAAGCSGAGVRGEHAADRARRRASTSVRYAFAPASPSAAAGTWIVQPAVNPWAYPPDTTSDQSFRIYDSTYLGAQEQVSCPMYTRSGVGYPVHGRYVFYDGGGTKRIAIVQVDANASLLNDHGVVVY